MIALEASASSDLTITTDGTVAFAGSALEVSKTITAIADALIEAVECYMLTLTIPTTSTLGDVVGPRNTAQICVIDGTGS